MKGRGERGQRQSKGIFIVVTREAWEWKDDGVLVSAQIFVVISEAWEVFVVVFERENCEEDRVMKEFTGTQMRGMGEVLNFF